MALGSGFRPSQEERTSAELEQLVGGLSTPSAWTRRVGGARTARAPRSVTCVPRCACHRRGPQPTCLKDCALLACAPVWFLFCGSFFKDVTSPSEDSRALSCCTAYACFF